MDLLGRVNIVCWCVSRGLVWHLFLVVVKESGRASRVDTEPSPCPRRGGNWLKDTPLSSFFREQGEQEMPQSTTDCFGTSWFVGSIDCGWEGLKRWTDLTLLFPHLRCCFGFSFWNRFAETSMTLLLPSFLIGIVLVLYEVEWQDKCWWSPPWYGLYRRCSTQSDSRGEAFQRCLAKTKRWAYSCWKTTLRSASTRGLMRFRMLVW
jgi:hypothetical protein